MEKTLYVTDLDGTLLTCSDSLSAFTVQTLNRLIHQGLPLTWATARSLSSSLQVTQGLATSLPVIVHNGAFILNAATGERLLSETFTESQKALAAREIGRHGLDPLVYALLDGRERVSYRAGEKNEGTAFYLSKRQGDPRFRAVTDDSALYGGEAYYFTCIGEKEALLPLWEEMKNRPEFTCTFQQELYRQEYWLELMPKKATKAAAAQRLKELLSCDRIVAFGDGINDLPLFAAADEAYAMENAVEELKAAATAVIGSNEKDGVAKWLLNHAAW